MKINPLVCDIYHGDGHFEWANGPRDSVDFHAAYAWGLRGVIHKATQGVTTVDRAYAPRRQRAIGAGLLYGAYDFNDGSPPVKQAQYFWNVADWDENLRLFLDYEDNRLSNMSIGHACDYLQWMDAKMTGGHRCGIYSGNRLKDQIIHATPDQRNLLGERDLWLAQYGPVPRLKDANARPLPWTKYFLWQYTGDGIGLKPHNVPGIQRNMDLDHFDGTAGELREVWATPWAKPAA